MNKSLPPSYTFKTDPQTEGAKYTWSFGDGTYSDSPMPTHKFKVSNYYGIYVKVLNPDGKTCVGEIKEKFEGENASTTPTPAIISGKGKVKDLSTVDGCGLVIALENGTILVPVQMLSNFLLKEGQYVELAYEMLNEAAKCQAGKPAKIHRISEITTNTTCRLPISIIKNATSPVSYTFKTETQPEGSKYYWYFGDGGSSERPNPTYTFKKGGSYPVTLKVLHSTGKVCYGEIKETFAGETVQACKAYFTASNQMWSDPAMMKKMVFANLSTGDIKECLWNFGDNTTSTELKPTHEYAAFGEYKVCLIITTASGCKSDYCAVVKVADKPVVSGCAFDLVVKPKPETPNTFLFYAISRVEITAQKWSFGDGGVSELANPEHKFEKPGIYEIKCTITTKDGCTETRTIKHAVNPPLLPSCEGAFNIILYDPTENKCNGKAVVKLIDGTGAEVKNVKYIWHENKTGNTMEGLCPDRPYTVQAIIDGVCQKSYSFSFLSKPIWKLQNINGKNNFTVIEPVEGIQYEWDFGNGVVLKGASVDYNFEKEGIYDVKLKAVSGADFSEYSQQVVVAAGVTAATILKESEFKIFPNPVRDVLRIYSGASLSGNLFIEIMNIAGQKIYAQPIDGDKLNSSEINISHLKSGIYFLRITNGRTLLADRKFIKDK
jgi:PKD repeat protein